MKTQDTYKDYTFIKSLFKNERNEIMMAKRNSDGQTVVLKQSKLLNDDVSWASRLAHEYDVLKDLDHSGIPKVLDILYDGKTVTMVQEFIDGSDLKRLPFNRKISFAEVLAIAIQLSEILHYLHQKKIIHKDINTSNIMLAKNGVVKLIDFGISYNLYSESNDVLKVDQIEGTLTYISPEQTGRTTYPVTQSCDFYSFGILLYELLTGKPPFDSVDPLEVIHFQLSRNPIPLQKIIPNLPDGLDKVVTKLMQKNPDERYHSASGLKSDLVTIQKHLVDKKPLLHFIAGLNDASEQYKQSQKLYGREREVEELMGYYKNQQRSKSMLVMVSGYSGVGKSALIKHIKFPIIQSKGTFLSGKFDQFKKDIPYYAFIEAIQEFLKNLLSEPEEKMNYWRERILNVLGENASLITEVVPLLSKIIGKQSQVAKLQPAQQESRFHMAVIDFIYAFSTSENPLVLFLDDLQWADLPSLNLVLRILQNPKQENILILGAYRENELEKGHPLLITLNQINDAQGYVKEIKLQPLNLETTCKITADSFGMNASQSNDLGQHIFAKTKGNPFFIHSFLKTLYDKKLVTKALEKDWIWDNEQIEKLDYTDNVIDLMTDGLIQLPQETQQELKNASALGNTFSLTDLTDLSNKSQEKVFTDLVPAIKVGYLTINNSIYREIALSALSDDFNSEKLLSDKKVKFTFLHDKVQQAAYTLIPETERLSLHLKIGRLLLQNRNENQIQEDIFELVNHFALSYHLIDETNEKEQVAKLCLSAGKKAKDSTSYTLAISFLNIAKNLLGYNSWTEKYDLTYNVILNLGECEYLNDNPITAEKYFKEVLKASKSRFEKLQVYYLHSSLYLKIGNTIESLRLGREAAKMYNIRFPKHKVTIQIFAIVTLMKYLFLFSTKYKNTDLVLNQKNCEDEERIALHKFLIDLATSAYQQDQNLMMLVIFKIIKLYIKDGFTDASGFGFSGFSVVVLSALKMQKRGFGLWEITKRMHQKTQSPLIKWRLSYTVNGFENHRSKPFTDSYEDLLQMIKACRINGDQIFTAYSVALELRIKFFASMPLTKLIESTENRMTLIENSQGGLDFMLSFFQLVKVLNSPSIREKWDDETYDTKITLERLTKENNRTKLALFHTPKLVFHYFLGQYRESLHESENAKLYFDNVLGDICQTAHTFYSAMTVAAIYNELNRKEQKKWLKTFKNGLKTMQLYADGCPENFASHYNLLIAEQHVINYKFMKALHFYEKAIQLSTENKIIYIKAIACERAALLCKTNDLQKQEQLYIQEAWTAYNEWGAVLKCKQLENNYPDFFNIEVNPSRQNWTQGSTITSLSSKSALDLSSILKASQTIASQVKYEGLLKSLMHITIESAGAEKGCLLLLKGKQLCIEAVGVSGKEDIEILPSLPFEETDIVPKTIINYCRRTNESVVVNQAIKEPRFCDDAYILKNKTLSILCVPITVAGKMKGLLYLENKLLKGVFNADRIELLQMISGQIGISIENSILYENLEEKVLERTKKIEKTLNELKATQNQLIQSEKMASLGELTAGIAHEIQNPLNFVNNFSEVSAELLTEMKTELQNGNTADANEIADDVIQNLEKINHHGKRADAIVKGMLQHSRSSSGKKEPTDLNALCDEYLRLSYHGLRAKDKSFNATMKTDFDESIGNVNLIPQDFGRVILNLLNNAFYAVNEKKNLGLEGFEPTVSLSTKKENDKIIVTVTDNGNRMPQAIIDKIFQPFFTTKPTGKGTGLGLSLSYDIITKGHNGELKVESKEGEQTKFIITLPE